GNAAVDHGTGIGSVGELFFGNFTPEPVVGVTAGILAFRDAAVVAPAALPGYLECAWSVLTKPGDIDIKEGIRGERRTENGLRQHGSAPGGVMELGAGDIASER